MVGQKGVELSEIRGVVAPWDPDFEVAVRAVFFVEVIDGALIMSGFVEMGIIGQTILDSPADYRFGFDETVGLGYYKAIFIAGLMPVGCPVVFNGLTHNPNLLGRETSGDKLV